MAERFAGRASRASLLCLVLLAGVMLAGCGDGGGRDLPPEWRGRDVMEPGWANATLQPGWGLGLEYVWPAGREIGWDWFVEGPRILHYQVVRIEAGEADPIRAMFANESAASLTVIRSGTHQLLWRNEGSLPVLVWYHVPEGHGGPRPYSPSEGPDCTVLLADRPAAASAAVPGSWRC